MSMTAANILRERAARLRRKADYVVRKYGNREGDDAWSWLLGTAEDLDRAADEITAASGGATPRTEGE